MTSDIRHKEINRMAGEYIHFMFLKSIEILLSMNEIIYQMQNPLDFTPILKVICSKCKTNNRARVNKLPFVRICFGLKYVEHKKTAKFSRSFLKKLIQCGGAERNSGVRCESARCETGKKVRVSTTDCDITDIYISKGV